MSVPAANWCLNNYYIYIYIHYILLLIIIIKHELQLVTRQTAAFTPNVDSDGAFTLKTSRCRRLCDLLRG